MYPDVASLSASVVYAPAHCVRQMVSAFGATTAPNIIEHSKRGSERESESERESKSESERESESESESK